MSRAEVIAAGCAGKETFDTFNEAARTIRRRARGKNQIRQREPYRCRFCRKFHVGTNPTAKRRARAQKRARLDAPPT